MPYISLWLLRVAQVPVPGSTGLSYLSAEPVTQPVSTAAIQNKIQRSCLSDDAGFSILCLSGNQLLWFMEEIKVSRDHSSPSRHPVQKEVAGAISVRSPAWAAPGRVTTGAGYAVPVSRDIRAVNDNTFIL